MGERGTAVSTSIDGVVENKIQRPWSQKHPGPSHGLPRGDLPTLSEGFCILICATRIMTRALQIPVSTACAKRPALTLRLQLGPLHVCFPLLLSTLLQEVAWSEDRCEFCSLAEVLAWLWISCMVSHRWLHH